MVIEIKSFVQTQEEKVAFSRNLIFVAVLYSFFLDEEEECSCV